MAFKADAVGFDLLDTLITRKVLAYTDVFELVDLRLREKGIWIPDFAKFRLYAEKELSRDNAPGLENIYKYVLKKVGGRLHHGFGVGCDKMGDRFCRYVGKRYSLRYFSQASFRRETGCHYTDSYYSGTVWNYGVF